MLSRCRLTTERFAAAAPPGCSILPSIGKNLARALGCNILGFAAAILLAMMSQTRAASLGGAYFVDDAEIGSPGSCEVEHWGSFAANSDHILVSNPACVFNLGRPVELGTTFLRTRSDGEFASTVAASAKTVFIASGGQGWGIGASGSVTYDLSNKALNGLIANIPVTYDVNKELRFNINAGVQYDPTQNQAFMTTGAGVAWNFVKPLSLLAEVFAVIGPGETNPRYQVGIRYLPTKSVDVDVIYGRNLTGERSNWITLGVNFRTGED
jgi:hypothetical protein